MRKSAVRLLIFIHFLIILLTVSHLHEKIRSKRIIQLVDYYSALTYTNRNFGFFAPEVYGDLDVNFDLYADTSTLLRKVKFRASGTEMRARFYTLAGHFAESSQFTVMDLYARSWGVKLMNDNPDVNKVVVTVYQHVIPTMKAYRQGRRIEKEFYYTTTIQIPDEK